MAAQKEKYTFFSILLFSLYIFSGFLLLYVLWNGFDYYSTPLALRVRHPEYKLLKPGGFYSHGLGILGSLMLISLLFYSIRKRFKLFQNYGRLSNWLKVHIFFGITGPLFIILHSTFKLNGLVSVSFWSMIAVALSGILGRFLYNQIPRTLQGKEISLEEAKTDAAQLNTTLQQKFNLSASDTAEIRRTLHGSDTNEKRFLNLLFSGLSRPLRLKRLKHILVDQYKIPKENIPLVVQTSVHLFTLQRRILLWNKIHNLFDYWHVFHKPFAIIMYLIMFVHISISVWLGYTWIF